MMRSKKMESHRGKYDIVQNPEDPNDTSVCILLKEGPFTGCTIKYGKFKFKEGPHEDGTMTAKYEYEFVDVPYSIAEKEFTDEVGEEFENFIGEILIEYLDEQIKSEQEYNDDEGRTVRKYNFAESSN